VLIKNGDDVNSQYYWQCRYMSIYSVKK